MDMQSNNDLANLRAIAEEGRYAPLMGGAHLVSYGSIFATIISILWIAFQFPKVLENGVTTFIGVCILSLIVLSTFLGRRFNAKPTSNTTVSKIERSVWRITHLSVMICFFAINLATAFGRDSPVRDYSFMGTVVFCQYGVALFVTAVISKQKWLQVPAFGALAAAMSFIMIGPNLIAMPITAAYIILLAVIPGIILMRQEKSA